MSIERYNPTTEELLEGHECLQKIYCTAVFCIPTTCIVSMATAIFTTLFSPDDLFSNPKAHVFRLITIATSSTIALMSCIVVTIFRKE